MKKVLYRPSWQKLRVSCLAENHPQGGFTTAAGVNDNLARLSNYISDAYQCYIANSGIVPQVEQETLRMKLTYEEEYACRVWRVLNLLNATRMGYQGQGLGGSELDVRVFNYRNSIQDAHNGSAVLRAEQKWKWDVVRFELEEMWRLERYWFTKINSDLRRRAKVANKRRQRSAGPQVDETRPELLQFLALMDDVNLH